MSGSPWIWIRGFVLLPCPSHLLAQLGGDPGRVSASIWQTGGSVWRSIVWRLSVLVTVIISHWPSEKPSSLNLPEKPQRRQTSSRSLNHLKEGGKISFLPGLLFIQYVRNSAWDTGFVRPDYCLRFVKWNLRSWGKAEETGTFSTNLQKVCLNQRDQPRGSSGSLLAAAVGLYPFDVDLTLYWILPDSSADTLVND